MPRSDAPLGKAKIWAHLIEYARENNIEIDTGFAHKIYWMEDHKGVCFCSWDSGRVCPCGRIDSDFKEYNGQCLCGVLLTKERLEQKNKYYKRKAEKELERKELEKQEMENIVDK